MSKIILYTINCPKCNVLEKKLSEKNIPFISISDIEVFHEKHFQVFPMLEVNGEVMGFKQAVDWINGVDMSGSKH